ncbi:hypothetical protein LEP1GSC193_0262 [Leptospira alstonii serovar Pingchang str. 80-412]|uniref:Uncharacterized protein n=2 Tax=Leptospira alstonii TaxID=28452 RepID=M6CPT2_9LEPT|nr:hypothetical protein LEP1GSC194_0069 [Leptospira alstonii serovar Sichuan str. 79601]EQA81775.1 hypothetical protein LEP1GSC193_0262 [Leptospira alstonii serovar Pingchang str. 80-412]
MFPSHKISSEVDDFHRKFPDSLVRPASIYKIFLNVNLVGANYDQFLCERGHPNL